MLSRIRQHVDSERKLGKKKLCSTFKRGFQRVSNHFYGVSKDFLHSKGLESVSKLQDLLQIFWETNRYHFDGSSTRESKEPRFRILEIEAICSDIHTSKILSNEFGFWRREPRLVAYATKISLPGGGFEAIDPSPKWRPEIQMSQN